MSSTASNQDQDLQTYLDTFNKEIEEVTLSAEAVEALTGVEEEQQSNECQDDVGAEGEEDDGSTYIVDRGGYYYFQSSETAGSGAQVATEPSAAILKEADKTTASNVIDEEAEADDVGYVFIMDDGEVKSESVVAAETEADVEAENSELIDTGEADRKEVYEFDETEIPEKEEGDDPPIKTGKVIRLRPVNSDPNAEVHRCMHCEYTTTKRFRLSRHLKFHSDDRPFRCSVCERGFKTNASLMNHVNVHLGNKPHACESCEMRFTTSGELMRHMRYRHTGEKPHKCSECDYSSVELSKLRRHMRCHTGERPYQCPHCTYASPDTFKLKRHLRTHTGEKPYECEICNARFTQSNSLKSHRLIHSVGDKPVFQCSLCPTTCGRKTDLRLHVQKLHHSEHPITCKRCGKDLPDRYSYKMHSKTHEGERCYRCKLCPYASISMRHLESHMLVHTDQKPYICETCGMSFRQRPLLSRHVNLYHNKDYVPPTPREKVHTCPHCKRAFTHKGNLMRHMEMHDPESNAEWEKVRLKIGRMTRLQPDGSVLTVGTGKIYGEDDDIQEEYEEEDNVEGTFGEEDFEIIETIDEEVEQKPVVTEAHNSAIDNTTTVRMEFVEDVNEAAGVSIKKESECKELLAVEVEDGQQYMIVLQTDDEDEDDDAEKCIAAKIIELPASNKKNTGLSHSFGFEEEEGEEYNDDASTKETIQLLEIIDEN